MSSIRAVLRRFLIMATVPLTVGGLVFLFFQAIQDSYSVEARLELEDLSQPAPDPGPGLETQPLMEQSVRLLQSERMRTLLGYQLLVHDLTEAPALVFPEWRAQLSRTQRLNLIDTLSQRLKHLSPGPVGLHPQIDSLLRHPRMVGAIYKEVEIIPD
ncbi:MAG: hypothetical protein D6722_02375, partial [Bacteroidetes bacterium]